MQANAHINFIEMGGKMIHACVYAYIYIYVWTHIYTLSHMGVHKHILPEGLCKVQRARYVISLASASHSLSISLPSFEAAAYHSLSF